MLKKIGKICGVLAAAALILASAGYAYLRYELPPRYPLPTVTLPKESARIEHGRYLVQHVALCVECHSQRDRRLFAGPVKEGTLGAGGEAFPGDFGVLYAPNITPAGLKGWSNEDLARAVTTGVRPDGTALFPLMPFPHYAKIDERDLEDILAYIRQLKPIESPVPKTKLVFPFTLLVNTMSTEPTPSPRPAETDGLKYGEYLTNMAACTDCHTPRDKGTPIAGLEFAGGSEFALPSGTVRSANITPDPQTGIGSWSRATFVARFKNPKARHNQTTPMAAGETDTTMPWRSYAGMSDEDLGAIYTYLHSRPAVKHSVERYAATP